MLEVKYFGMIAEELKLSSEEIELKKNSSVAFFKSELLKKYPALNKINFQIAVDKEIVNNEFMITKDCEIAVLPPFAGG